MMQTHTEPIRSVPETGIRVKYLIIDGYPVIKGNLVVRKVEIAAMKNELRG